MYSPVHMMYISVCIVATRVSAMMCVVIIMNLIGNHHIKLNKSHIGQVMIQGLFHFNR